LNARAPHEARDTHAAAAVLATAAQAVAAVLVQGRSADDALQVHERDPQRRAIRAVTLGTLRWCLRFEAAVMPLLSRAPGETPPVLRALLVTAVHQLEQSRNPRESTVSAAVDAARLLGHAKAAGAINAVLRRYLRERETLLASVDANLEIRSAHPAWLVEALLRAWPEDAEAVLLANNEHPPLTLRVDESRVSVSDYLQQLSSAGLEARAVPWLPGAVTILTPVPVSRIPGFATGTVSVQDASAQLAARLLAPGAGERVLDACAAPGGKTGALLELATDLHVTAVDSDRARLQQVDDNLRRLGRTAQLIAADLGAAPDWWHGQVFDAILLDAPCSATGVVRRHPDIKLLRRPSDIAPLARRQLAILVNCWRLLRPGGRLLYVTCSLLPEENQQVVEGFLASEPTAHEAQFAESFSQLPWRRCAVGWQMLPGGEAGGDGFYYACLARSP
jgi:16S rRNA (cytosine967-C5)-methyltransferase